MQRLNGQSQSIQTRKGLPSNVFLENEKQSARCCCHARLQENLRPEQIEKILSEMKERSGSLTLHTLFLDILQSDVQ